MKLLIAILSALDFEPRRDICRLGWMRQLGSLSDVSAFFVVGMGELPPDAVTAVLCPDDYHSLTLKVKATCQYALTLDFDYLFKCDDDTFIHVARLLRRAEEAMEAGEEYVGEFIGDPPFAQGGAGYLLSRRSVELLAASPCPVSHREDGFTSKVLRGAGVFGVHDKRFNRYCTQFPSPDNEQITCHAMRNSNLARTVQRAIEEHHGEHTNEINQRAKRRGAT